MPFHTHSAAIFLHVFSRLDPETKDLYRKKYIRIKKYGSASAIAGIGIADGTQLAKDIISSKLRAYGYKSLFAIALGPAVQFASLPGYIFTYGSRLRRFSLAASKLGAKISKGQMGIVNWGWVGADIIFFGEPVSITENSDYLIVGNETVGKLAEAIEECLSAD